MMIAVGLSIALCIGGALLAVSLRNILHAVFGLAISLMGVAGVFFCLGSPFVAAMEVLVYVGGISVAMVFAVMMSVSIGAKNQPQEDVTRKTVAMIVAAGFFGAMAWLVQGTEFSGLPVEPGTQAWGLEAIGTALLTHYNLVFETLSVILLVAIMGAITIGNMTDADDEQEAGS